MNPGFNTTASGSNTYLAQIGVVAGSGTVQGLQTIQYSYHIRDWLTGINSGTLNHSENDLFGYQLDYEADGAYFDGNIRKQTWVTKRDQKVRSYTYRYDLANRLTYATYVGSQNENYRTQGISYDRSGNITHLHRQGLKATNTYGSIDQLTYIYATNSNKLLSVTDAITDNTDMGDFRDGNTSGNDYTYWPNGSLKKDLNKAMTADISYNYLELTTQVTTSAGTIQTWYDGAGGKLRKTVNGTTTDYVGEMIWVGNQPYQLVHGEGRAVPNGGSWLLEFNYLDHLGNLRLAFRDSLGSAVSGVYPPPVITQINAYSDFGMPLKGLDFTNSIQSNKFTFNGKEIEESLGWHDFGFRHLDRTIGRWTQIDPLAEKYYSLSSFSSFLNDPIILNDIDGKDVDPSKLNSAENIKGFRDLISTDEGKKFIGQFMKANTAIKITLNGKTEVFQFDKDGARANDLLVIASASFNETGTIDIRSGLTRDYEKGNFQNRLGNDEKYDVRKGVTFLVNVKNSLSREESSNTLAHEFFVHVDQDFNRLSKLEKGLNDGTIKPGTQEYVKQLSAIANSAVVDHTKLVQGHIEKYINVSAQLDKLKNTGTYIKLYNKDVKNNSDEK